MVIALLWVFGRRTRPLRDPQPVHGPHHYCLTGWSGAGRSSFSFAHRRANWLRGSLIITVLLKGLFQRHQVGGQLAPDHPRYSTYQASTNGSLSHFGRFDRERRTGARLLKWSVSYVVSTTAPQSLSPTIRLPGQGLHIVASDSGAENVSLAV